MKQGILIFVAWLMLGCFGDNRIPDIISTPYDENYLCSEYEVEDDSYSFNTPVEHNIKIIEILKDVGEMSFTPQKVVDRLNNGNSKYQGFREANLFFRLNGSQTKIYTQLKTKRLRYRDLLKSIWDQSDRRSIILVVIPDDVEIYENSGIEGAAYGVPRLTGVGDAKPILFVKRSLLFNGVLFHEMGHVKGLLHIFHMEDFVNMGYNCTHGDKVPDTVTPGKFSGITQDCEYIPGDNERRYTREELAILTRNYESYSDPECMNMWTPGQIQKMRKMVYFNPLLRECRVQVEVNDIFVSE